MSRGASSARSSKRSIKRSPSGKRKYAPSPRIASVIKNERAWGWYKQVGWN